MKFLMASLFSILSLSLGVSVCNKAAWSASSAVYPFSLMTLPYTYDYLQPIVSSAIVAAHHDHHHLTYVTKLNAYLATVPAQQSSTLLSLVVNAGSNASLQKFAGGDYNHNMLWWETTSPSCAAPGPVGQLATDINTVFGSYANFQAQFQTASAGLFGSGWAWLCADSNLNLIITTTANQMNPLMTNTCNPILGSDLWEHAYYLQYMYNKDSYFANFWSIVDWAQVGYFYENYVLAGNPIPF
jgi:superoxide dismutase, Fe-Mn family